MPTATQANQTSEANDDLMNSSMYIELSASSTNSTNTDKQVHIHKLIHKYTPKWQSPPVSPFDPNFVSTLADLIIFQYPS